METSCNQRKWRREFKRNLEERLAINRWRIEETIHFRKL